MSEQQLSRRHFVMAAGAAAAWHAAEPASADDPVGKWKVKIQWPERTVSEVIWTLNSNGGFTSSDGFNGVWARRGSLLIFAVHGGNEPSYAGNLSDLTIQGIALQPNGRKGFWGAERQP
ncbi:MAG TPA: hypothetical protein VN493_31815 [Thermoanaerobaculia bacterium]|nr:hypothetical protein [Thermoanaerobaculia bacterium]